MKTREDLQAWMRDGCPIEDRFARNCRQFRLEIWRAFERGALVATCLDCWAQEARGGIEIQWGGPGPYGGVDQILGVSEAVRGLSDWLTEHAKEPGGHAWPVFAGDKQTWDRVLGWVRAAMRGGNDALTKLSRSLQLSDVKGNGYRFELWPELGDREGEGRWAKHHNAYINKAAHIFESEYIGGKGGAGK